MPSCSPFWYTVDTMQALHGYDYHAFELFGPVHLFWLGLCAFLCAGGSVLFRRLGPAGRQRVLRVLTLLLLADELLKDVSSLATGQFVWAFLPFHLCSINLFICVWYALRPHPLAAEVLYALCLPGAAAALLFPSWQALPLWNVMHLHSSTVHTMLVLFPVLLLAGGFRPDARQLPKVFGVFCLDVLAAALVNHLCGTNFMFLRGSYGNAALGLIEQVFGAGPGYLAGLALIVCAVWAALYAPWITLSHRKNSYKLNKRKRGHRLLVFPFCVSSDFEAFIFCMRKIILIRNLPDGIHRNLHLIGYFLISIGEYFFALAVHAIIGSQHILNLVYNQMVKPIMTSFRFALRFTGHTPDVINILLKLVKPLLGRRFSGHIVCSFHALW